MTSHSSVFLLIWYSASLFGGGVLPMKRNEAVKISEIIIVATIDKKIEAPIVEDYDISDIKCLKGRMENRPTRIHFRSSYIPNAYVISPETGNESRLSPGRKYILYFRYDRNGIPELIRAESIKFLSGVKSAIISKNK